MPTIRPKIWIYNSMGSPIKEVPTIKYAYPLALHKTFAEEKYYKTYTITHIITGLSVIRSIAALEDAEMIFERISTPNIIDCWLDVELHRRFLYELIEPFQAFSSSKFT